MRITRANSVSAAGPEYSIGPYNLKSNLIKAVSKIGFWFNIKADARFNPEVRLRRIEGFEPSAQHRD
jgi:hypothetical protein